MRCVIYSIMMFFLSFKSFALVLDGFYGGDKSIDDTRSSLYRYHPRSTYISISPDQKVSGMAHTGNNDSEYVTMIYSSILRIAGDIAAEQLEMGNKDIYYAFLMMALMVPYHESRLMHFRINEPEMKYDKKRRWRGCSQYANSGKNIFYTNKTTGKYVVYNPEKKHKIFKGIFRDEFNPIAPDCSRLNQDSTTAQLLSSGLLEDMGIMQLNFAAHTNMYLAKDILSLEKTLNYGLSYLYKGLRQIVLNKKKYPCILNADGSINVYNLIRGNWAGKYNSGHVKKTCRFARDDSHYSHSDALFQRRLYDLVFGNDTAFSLHLTGNERDSFLELRKNFKNIAFTPYRMNVSDIDIRLERDLKEENICGTLTKGDDDLTINVYHVDDNGMARINPIEIEKFIRKKEGKKCYKTVNSIAGSQSQKYFNKDFFVSVGKNRFVKIDNEKVIISDNINSIIQKKDNTHVHNDGADTDKVFNSRYVVKSKVLNIRERADTSGPVCGAIFNKKLDSIIEVTELSEDGKWARFLVQKDSTHMNQKPAPECINADGFYVSRRYLEQLTGVYVKAKIKAGTTGYLKSYPTSTSRKRGKMVAGERYHVVDFEDEKETNARWYKVVKPNSQTHRWVNASDVLTVED